ncbi:MAG: DUF1501 domain-containing protein [Verrucomicrobiota bacterium]
MTNRRNFLRGSSLGFGGIALNSLLAGTANANPLAASPAHFPARAKRIIFLFMEGGPSSVDTFDFKPDLIKYNEEPIPADLVPRVVREGKAENPEKFGSLTSPVSNFQQRGDSGLWISDLFPNIAKHADDLCVLNGVHADNTAHGPATQQFHTGHIVLSRPSMGSWILYGLGTENEDMPGFVVVSPPAGTAINCGNSFLPAIYQATVLQDADKEKGEKIRYLDDQRLPRELRQQQLGFLQRLNQNHLQSAGEDARLEGMIESFELAFRMQQEAPEVLDITGESDATNALYGIDNPKTEAFGRQCLTARRLAEAGVRFIQVTSKGWDHHSDIAGNLKKSCVGVDKPIAGLLTDLKLRGLLDDTLVLWSGEFGRTPVWQALNKKDPPGRGHNPFGFSLWMAGGGVKGGFAHGSTDNFGYSAVDGRVHVHDLHATLLHLLGLDHEKLTYRYAGRDFRLTDVYGNIVKEILA